MRLSERYLRLARSLVHLAQLENAIELEAPVLVDRRKAVEDKTPLFARSIWDLHGREWNGRWLRVMQRYSRRRRVVQIFGHSRF
jgi:hypothetical protein